MRERRYHLIPLGQDPQNAWDEIKLWLRERFTTPRAHGLYPYGRIDPYAGYGSWAPGFYPPAMPERKKSPARCCNSETGCCGMDFTPRP